MAKKFNPLVVDLIEEGRFKTSMNEELAAIQTALINHIDKYGPDATDKSSAELTIKVKLQRSSSDPDSFSVKTSFARKSPGRPAHVTFAIRDNEQTGEPRLFVRASGSDSDAEARQHKLCTEDGRPIDPRTGEILEPPANRKGKA